MSARPLLFALLALAPAVGCALVLGADKDYYEVGGGGGGADGGSSGSGSTTSTTSASTGSTSSSSPSCRPLHDLEDCDPGERCTVIDTKSGKLGCVPIAAEPKVPYERCDDDDGCPAGTLCDYRTSTCAPLCDGAVTCPTTCAAAKTRDAEGTTSSIPGVSTCVAHCNPLLVDACGPGATCAYDPGVLDFECFFHNGVAPGGACMYINDCPPQYVCTSACFKWCHPADDFGVECQGPCSKFGNATIIYDGVSYGFCPP